MLRLSRLGFAACCLVALGAAPRASQRIAFASNRDGNWELYVMNADGSGQTRLTWSAGNDFDPSFSPDGRKIAFVSEREGNYDVWVMNQGAADPWGDLTAQRPPPGVPAWSRKLVVACPWHASLSPWHAHRRALSGRARRRPLAIRRRPPSSRATMCGRTCRPWSGPSSSASPRASS